MNTALIITLIILVVALAVLIVLSIYGRKLQKKSEANQALMKEGAQTVSILVIDKKRIRLKEANLPKIVVDQTPKYLRRSKVPIVKAKIGPKVMNLMCDDKVFDLIPVKKEVKAVINGIYIMDVKGLRVNLDAKPVKKSLVQKLKSKISNKENATKQTNNKTKK